jgi:hypothetical protein
VPSDDDPGNPLVPDPDPVGTPDPDPVDYNDPSVEEYRGEAVSSGGCSFAVLGSGRAASWSALIGLLALFGARRRRAA